MNRHVSQKVLALALLQLLSLVDAFVVPSILSGSQPTTRTLLFQQPPSNSKEAREEEEGRLKILKGRRNDIRAVLRLAERVRNFRLAQGFVPELDHDGKPVTSDGKLAVTLTAFVVAAGAIALRIGGRAALMSAVGLDFMNDNPELKANLEYVLTTAESMDPIAKLGLFTAAWTAVKCFCFDAGGVVLALASGLLFGGVFEGAFVSATAATFGSSVAFGLAKLETPVREKALELLEEYPSLRGIEKTVARDGLKAVLTLRLAPVLPIPLGLYNYIYGVTNVGFPQFAGGIFLGSLKPYLLDSYLGYFGKSLIDGGLDSSGTEETILLAALGVSVLVGVFASELASKTWDSVIQEIEEEKAAAKGEESDDDGVTTELFGWELPQGMVGFQYSMKEADERVRGMVATETEAQVWNYTKDDPPTTLNPACFPDSPEIQGAYEGIDVAAALCDGLVLSPILFETFFKYADPLLDATGMNATEVTQPVNMTSTKGPNDWYDTMENSWSKLQSTRRECDNVEDLVSTMKFDESVSAERKQRLEGKLASGYVALAKHESKVLSHELELLRVMAEERMMELESELKNATK